ncbi:glycosyltransferase family 2 protein [Parabacteroides sp.]|uniref:glycosyltransferase family 2 protein n=1 Tax=Parabacteroides sp. TaxID=1869337 RepID=UPI00257F9193|nr:glycosyltransferase family 2 protein [Parabacteroides sp.]
MKNLSPKVSICVPVYKVEKYIEKCARSLFEQTLAEIEYIFVNDCSPDGSFDVLREVIEDYPDRKPFIRLIKHASNQGPGVARKTAASLATGDYLYFPDSDDWLELDMMRELYEKAEMQNAELLLFRAIQHTRQGNFTSERFICATHDEWVRSLLQIKAPALWQRFIKTSLYRKAESEEDMSGLIRFEDYYLSFKLHYYAKNTSFVDKVYYHYNHLNSESLTSNSDLKAPDSSILVGTMIENFIRRECLYETYKYEIESLKQMFADSYLSSTYWNPDRWLKLTERIDQRYVRKQLPKTVLQKGRRQVLAYLVWNHHIRLARILIDISRLIKGLGKFINTLIK